MYIFRLIFYLLHRLIRGTVLYIIFPDKSFQRRQLMT